MTVNDGVVVVDDDVDVDVIDVVHMESINSNDIDDVIWMKWII
jgi:hypothetical protein